MVGRMALRGGGSDVRTRSVLLTGPAGVLLCLRFDRWYENQRCVQRCKKAAETDVLSGQLVC